MTRRLYHCTTAMSAERILREGFYPNYDLDLFDTYWEDYGRMLGDEWMQKMAQAEYGGVGDFRKLLKQLRREWLEKFEAGTMIWVFKVPDDTYGDYCLQVTIPPGSKRAYEKSDWLWWVPMKPIPPKYFKLVRGSL